MFRSILSQSPQTFVLANVKLNYYCSKPRGFSEINQVTLVGTLISDAFTLKSGTKSLTVRTCDAERRNREIHSILTQGFDDLKEGQRVYISGSLAATSFKLEDGRTRKQIYVRAARTIVLDDHIENENTLTYDINQVDMVANVCRSATRMQNDSVVFQVATHFERNTEDGKTSATNFISVQAYDENLKKIAQNLSASDKVVIEGKLIRIPYIFPDGKKKYTGLVVAKSIEKVQLRAQQVDGADVGHEANNNNN